MIRRMVTPADIGSVVAPLLRIVWSDGHQSVYTWRSLRLSCPCAACKGEWTVRRHLDPASVPENVRALRIERVGAYAMMPFHSYADKPGIGEFLPAPVQERLDIYRREVLDRFDVPADRHYQSSHRGHLSHLQEGEAAVLTDEIVRMTTLTGTAEEIADLLRRLEAAGLTNLTIWIPPNKTREAVLEVRDRIMPLLDRTAA